MKKQVAFVPSLREAAFDTSKIDDESRTVEVVWSTGAAVDRRKFDWDTFRVIDFTEELDLSKGAVRMERFSSGSAPVLDGHASYSVRSDQVGVIQKAWLEGSEGRAILQISKREDCNGLWQDIKDGVVRNVSIGYRVYKYEIVKEDGKKDRYIARDWEPLETSFVPIPADGEAGVRSEQEANHRTRPNSASAVEIFNRASKPTIEEQTMMKVNGNTSAADEVAERGADANAEETRSSEQGQSWSAADMGKLHKRAQAFGLDAGAVFEVIGKARSLEEATDLLQERAVAKQPPAQGPRIETVRDAGDTVRKSIEVAIARRFDPRVKDEHGSENWRGLSVMEMARQFIQDSQNVRLRGLSRVEMAHVAMGLTRAAGMQSSSDFPLLLANTAAKRLRDTYAATVQTWRPIARQSNAPDLKERAIVTLSGMPSFLKVLEGAEYQYAKFGESRETYALAKYGRAMAFTEEMMINDDLGAFDNLLTHFGRAAAELESDLVWGTITSNPTMGDGTALFHADHGNLAGAGAVISEATVDAAEQAMGNQTDAAGKPINLRPRFLAVPPKHKVSAQKLLTSVTAGKTSDVNVYQNAMDLIVEQRLKPATGTVPWYLIADPAAWDTIEFAYLDGEEGVKTSTRVGFEVDGIEVKGRLFFAAKALDHRGFYQNPGT